MRAAHHRSRQSCVVVAACIALAGCAAEELAPTLWPPQDFRVALVEQARVGDRLAAVRRFEVTADGVCIYAVAREHLSLGAAGVLPVYDRLAVYRLVPECTRALARSLDRLGIGTFVPAADDRPAPEAGLALQWRAFGAERAVAATKPSDRSAAAIVQELAAHMPSGEPLWFGADPDAGVAGRLEGVPTPGADAAAAAAFWRQRALARPTDDEALLAAFALACAQRDRAGAEALLAQRRARAAQASASAPPDDAALQALLPADPGSD